MARRPRLPSVCALAAVLLVVTAQAATALPGDPDQGFGTDGYAFFDHGANEQAERVVQGPGGKLYFAGDVDAFFFTLRVKPGGDEDDTYGESGWAGVLVGEFGSAHGLAVAGDGAAVVVGARTVDGVTKGAVVKFDPNGIADAGFGGGDALAIVGDGSNEVQLADGVIQPDGKVVVAGWSESPGGHSVFLLARLKANGTLDPTFGQGGRVRTSFGQGHDTAYRIARQPDGKLVVGGGTEETALPGSYDVAFARYNADGTLDGSFGTNGKAVVSLFEGGSDVVNAMVLAPGGKVLSCVNGNDGDGGQHIALLRLTPKGRADLTFGGGDGHAIASSLGPTGCNDVAAQADGKPVVSANLGGLRCFAAVRFQANGRVDRDFGDDGVGRVNLGTTNCGVLAVTVQANGRIVLAGYVDFGNRDVAVARFLP